MDYEGILQSAAAPIMVFVLYAGIGQERRIAVHGYIDKAYGQVVVESTEQVFYFSGFGNGEIVAELLILLQHIVELFSIERK